MSRAGNGPREVHLPLIVTEVGGSTYEGPTGRTGVGPKKVITVLHKRTCTALKVVCFKVLRELVDKEKKLGTQEAMQGTVRTFNLMKRNPSTNIDDS